MYKKENKDNFEVDGEKYYFTKIPFKSSAYFGDYEPKLLYNWTYIFIPVSEVSLHDPSVSSYSMILRIFEGGTSKLQSIGSHVFKTEFIKKVITDIMESSMDEVKEITYEIEFYQPGEFIAKVDTMIDSGFKIDAVNINSPYFWPSFSIKISKENENKAQQ